MMDEKLKKDFLKGSVAATIGTVSSMFFHFISIMLLTRNLGKTDFGIYVLIFIFVNFFNILSSWGLNITLVKFISNVNKNINKASLRAILVLRAILLVILTIVFYSFSKFILPIFSLTKVSFELWIPLLFIAASYKDLFFNVLQGLNEYKKYSIVQTISAAIRVAAILLLLWLKICTLETIIYCEVFTSFVAVSMLLMAIPLKLLLNTKPNKETYYSIIKFSTPIHFNNILTFAYDRVSFLLIGAMLNPLSVALYDVSNKVPDALQKLFASFIIVYFPNSAKLFSAGKTKDALYLMNKAIVFFSITISFLTFLAFLFSKELVIILFSSAYILSAPAFAILMLNFYLRIMSNIIGYTIVSAGYSSVPVKVNIVSSIINVGLSLMLIPRFGFMGAVYSILIMNTIGQAAYHLYLAKLKLSLDSLKYLQPVIFLFLFGIIPFYAKIDSIGLKLVLAILFLVCDWIFISEFRCMMLKIIKLTKGYLHKIKFNTLFAD